MQISRYGSYRATRNVLDILVRHKVYHNGYTQVKTTSEGDDIDDTSIIIVGEDGKEREFDTTFFKEADK
jgi:hypothetical protein